MNMNNVQEMVDHWIKRYGVRYFEEKTNMLILMEEIGELSRWMSRKYGEQSYKNSEKSIQVEAGIKEELADVLFVLCCLANQMNVDLEEALKESIEKKTKRDENRHIQNDKLTP